MINFDDVKLSYLESKLFNFIKEVAEENGTVIRVAGGWVRDGLLDIESHDIDITVDNMSGAAFARLCNEKYGKGGTVSVIEARPEQSKHLETAMVKLFSLNIDRTNNLCLITLFIKHVNGS